GDATVADCEVGLEAAGRDDDRGALNDQVVRSHRQAAPIVIPSAARALDRGDVDGRRWSARRPRSLGRPGLPRDDIRYFSSRASSAALTVCSAFTPYSAYRSGIAPDWPNASTPSGTTGCPNAEPRNASVCDEPSSTVTIGACRSSV